MEATYLAAVLACGEGGFLAGRAAAHVYGISKRRAAPAPEVLTPGERVIPGIWARRTRGLAALDTTIYRAITATTAPRTLADLADLLSLDDLAEAAHHAHDLRAVEPAAVEAVLARHPTIRGAGRLRLVVSGDAPILLSRLEKAFRRLLRGAGLPLPGRIAWSARATSTAAGPRTG